MSLLDPSASYGAVAGATITITGDTFDITGFPAMDPGRKYEIITRYSGVPSEGVMIRLEAQF